METLAAPPAKTETVEAGRDVPAEPPVHTEHPELFHYTDGGGLVGILESRQLWATHYAHLNDATEVGHLRNYLVEALALRLQPYIIERKRAEGLSVRRRISRVGGSVVLARKEAANWVDNFYNVTFKGGRSQVPFAEPYIVSFCSHVGDLAYEREHGLLSQWRGYGGVERYAIVFDTVGLERLLKREFDTYDYPFLSLLDVIYNDRISPFERRFGPLLDLFERLYREMVERRDFQPGRSFTLLLQAAVRFKHQGFREEREVRIVACPMSPLMRAEFRKTNENEPNLAKRPKEIRRRELKTSSRSFIALFDFQPPVQLPIRRIIVGPHPRQDELAAKARKLIDNTHPDRDIPVMCSATPLR